METMTGSQWCGNFEIEASNLIWEVIIVRIKIPYYIDNMSHNPSERELKHGLGYKGEDEWINESLESRKNWFNIKFELIWKFHKTIIIWQFCDGGGWWWWWSNM